jgi:phosphatidylglycerophosphate synthase
MIGNRLHADADRARGALFALLIWSGVTPNQISCIGLALVLCNCAFYLVHRDAFFFGLGLALSYSADALDGALARQLRQTSKFGGYLDAVIDRYQEVASYAVLGLVNGWLLPALLVMSGSLMVSYNKAAVAIETPIEDKAWPDLMERQRRVVFLCAALMLDDAIPVPAPWGGHLALIAMYYLAVLTHFTALQRFLRARHILLSLDAGGMGRPS